MLGNLRAIFALPVPYLPWSTVLEEEISTTQRTSLGSDPGLHPCSDTLQYDRRYRPMSLSHTSHIPLLEEAPHRHPNLHEISEMNFVRLPEKSALMADETRLTFRRRSTEHTGRSHCRLSERSLFGPNNSRQEGMSVSSTFAI